jgi:phospholipase/lecithinase/hemolysin
MQSKFCQMIAGLCLFLGSVSAAYGYSNLVCFGDSLSDNGNIARFSDGQLWVELLQDRYSLNLIDRAYGGATTSYDNPAAGLNWSGLQWQVDQYAGDVERDTLITLWAGANDFLQQRDHDEAAGNIVSALEKLYAAGGKDFIVPNLPDIGSTPALFYQGSYLAGVATEWTMNFNSALSASLQDFTEKHSDVNLFFIDSFTIFQQYPVTTAEWLNLFWTVDYFHPSEAGHQLIFDTVVSALEAVPEPSTLILYGFGLTGIVLMGRRK